MITITGSELNQAYLRVKEIREDDIEQLYPEDKQVIEVGIERNPLIDVEFFDQESEFVTPIKLKFEFNSKLGKNGSYVLVTEVNILEEED